MNRKFSTLAVGLLLAGGLFSTANAEKFADVTDAKQYYRVRVNAAAPVNPAVNQWLDVDAPTLYSLDTDASTMWRVEQVKQTVNGTTTTIGYKLISAKTGEPLTVTVDGTKYDTFDASQPTSAGMWFTYGSKGFEGTLTSVGASATGSGTVWQYDLERITPITATATELNKILGNGFGLQICKQVIKSDGTIDTDKAPVEYADLQGNPFTGVLTAETGINGVKLYQADGKRIVLTSSTWGSQAGGTTQQGYKFAVMNQKEYTAASTATPSTIKADEFFITYPATVSGEPLEVSMMIGTTKYELVVTVIENVARLTVATSRDAAGEPVADYTYVPNASPVQNTYVKFGVSNLIDYAQFVDKLLNITRVPVGGGAVQAAAPSCNGEDYVPVAQVALDQPEGQWLIQDLAGIFKNRESGNVVTIGSLRATESADVFTDGIHNYTISAVGTPGETEDGYFATYTADQLKQKAFFIGTPIAATGETVYMTYTGNKIAWTVDKTEAVAFRFSKVIFGSDPKTDVVKHHTPYLGVKDNKIDTKDDVINFYRYNLAEVSTGKTLGYDEANKVFTLGDVKTEESNTAWNAYTVVLKSKGGNNYNILTGIDGSVLTATAGANAEWKTNDHAFCAAQKLYGAHNSNSLVKSQSAYNYVENDIFVISDADANMYRPVEAMDTIKIFRNADNNYVLYEQGSLLKQGEDAVAGFLGIENFLDPKFAEKNPALLVDTAAGYDTWRPEYLLALNATVVPEGKWCDFDQSADCPHAVATDGYVAGRYLVNLVDSAKAGRTDCKYQDLNNTTYYRLGFVQAKHIGDTLVIASTNDTINLTDNTVDKVCTFAFRYIDATRDAFRIETAYNVTKDADGDVETTTRGWIKYHNGIPVVTSNVSDAEVFDLETLEDVAPTANEAVAAAEVSVVAVNGAIIVKGAAGKVVTVANILGQTIANQVAASDNVTIAAPAGIAVVTVDGEATKVVVK